MNFIKGGDFFSLLSKKKKLPEEWVKFYAANIAMAIGHLHANKILHRDLKPENILINDNGYLKLTDYGTSKYVENNVTNNTFVGTR